MSRRRVLREPVEATLLSSRPTFIPVHKNHKGSRKAGLIYENKVSKFLTEMYGSEKVDHCPWFKYTDKIGTGFCSPDLLIRRDDYLIIGECKLNYKEGAGRKLKHIYLPVVRAVFPEDNIKLLQICKNLTGTFEDVLITALDDFDEEGLEHATWRLRI